MFIWTLQVLLLAIYSKKYSIKAPTLNNQPLYWNTKILFLLQKNKTFVKWNEFIPERYSGKKVMIWNILYRGVSLRMIYNGICYHRIRWPIAPKGINFLRWICIFLNSLQHKNTGSILFSVDIPIIKSWKILLYSDSRLPTWLKCRSMISTNCIIKRCHPWYR